MDINSILEEYTTSSDMFQDVNTLKLINDGDNARVKILLPNQEALLDYLKPVHRIKLNGYDNDVLCTGEDCPLCKLGYRKRPSLVLPLYNIDTKQIEFWKRGRKDIIKIDQLFKDGYSNLLDYTFKITRNGAKGSKDTTYSFNPLPKDIKVDGLEDKLSDIPNITGTDYKLILDLSEEQMLEAHETGKVTWTSNKKEENEEVPF